MVPAWPAAPFSLPVMQPMKCPDFRTFRYMTYHFLSHPKISEFLDGLDIPLPGGGVMHWKTD